MSTNITIFVVLLYFIFRATFRAIIEFVDIWPGTPTRHRGARSDRELGREIRRQGVQSAARGAAARGAGGRGATGTVAGFEDREIFGAQVAFAVSSSFGMAVSHRNSCIPREQQGESFLSTSELILSYFCFPFHAFVDGTKDENGASNTNTSSI